MVYTPYLACNWDVPTRISRLIDHCATVKQIGGIVDTPADEVVDLITLNCIHPQYRLTLDQARWMLRDGQLVFSLWSGVDRLFSLSFCLSSQDGQLRAFIGGLQGRREANALERYRLFSKLADGMRPRDFLVEAFKLLCRTIGVTEIKAVAASNHHSQSRATLGRVDLCARFSLNYDVVWHERGATSTGDGFFSLPLEPSRRSDEEIPARKRAMYRRRYEKLREIDQQLCKTLVVINPGAAAKTRGSSRPGGKLFAENNI